MTFAEPCCALKYYPEIEICVKEQKGEQEAKRKEAQRLEDENFGNHLIGRIRTYLWNLFEYPETSKQAQVSEIAHSELLSVLSKNYFIFGDMEKWNIHIKKYAEIVDNRCLWLQKLPKLLLLKLFSAPSIGAQNMKKDRIILIIIWFFGSKVR